MLDRQKAFDTALAHMRKQQHLAMDTYGSCRYRTRGGKYRCAIGALIPEDRYDKKIEGENAANSKVLACIPDASEEDGEFLFIMQSALHDDFTRNQDLRDGLETAAKSFAASYGLTYTPLREAEQ